MSELEWRAQAGAQVETEGHGLADVGVRSGPWSAELFTDTLDLRWSPVGDHGRASVGLRGAAFASGMWITPWTDGAPDDARKHAVWAVGPDLRVQRWLPRGLYAEAAGSGQRLGFTPLQGATLDLPDATVLRAEATLGGWWADGATAARATLGVDAWADGEDHAAPRAGLEVLLRPKGRWAPIGELRAGWADGQSDLVATRLGGLVPYVVPLAGAAWAEFWVEDFVAVRAGLCARPGPWTFGVSTDAAVFTPPTDTTRPDPDPQQGAVGLAGTAAWGRNGWFGELAAGGAPGLPRAEGVAPVSVFFRTGTDWR